LVASTTLSRLPLAAAQPAADDGFRLATAIARHPGRVDVGGIDQVEAGIDEGIKQREGSLLVGAPAKHVAAERQWGHLQAGAAQFAGCGHGSPPWV
jgi:hypothetical protein